MPIFRSHHQAALLAWLLLHPEHEHTLTELAKRNWRALLDRGNRRERDRRL